MAGEPISTQTIVPEENQLRELERRNEQEQQNFEKIMAAMAGATGGAK